mmetsp:Transcript_98406/g.275590  ORF Transcript_98406/g.275590 Transcript_98406/m.275590 type:complete len:207 (-) Transcript_98406:263-883(-)
MPATRIGTRPSAMISAFVVATTSASWPLRSGRTFNARTLTMSPGTNAAVSAALSGPGGVKSLGSDSRPLALDDDCALPPAAPATMLSTSGKAFMKSAWALFHPKDARASLRRSSFGAGGRMAPAVSDSSHMKDNKPFSTVDKHQNGFQLSGWKSVMERHRRVFVSKRPLGVSISIDGGRCGYSLGNLSFPQYQPPSYGVSAGPSNK